MSGSLPGVELQLSRLPEQGGCTRGLLRRPGAQVQADITKAANILDEDHYGLEKVKKRILEYLAVRKLKSDMKGPI